MVDQGTWTGTPTLGYGYQWQRCASGGSCASISGAIGSSYTLVAADVGQRIVVGVTATNAAGSQAAGSVATGTVSTGKPFTRVSPSVSGAERDGQVLTAASGAWTGTGPIA